MPTIPCAEYAYLIERAERRSDIGDGLAQGEGKTVACQIKPVFCLPQTDARGVEGKRAKHGSLARAWRQPVMAELSDFAGHCHGSEEAATPVLVTICARRGTGDG